MADPGGQAPQEGGKRGISIASRMLLMALVYLFIRRYVGDGSVRKAPTASADGSSRNKDDVRLPAAPLDKDARAPRDTLTDFIDEDDIAGLGGKDMFIQPDATSVEARQFQTRYLPSVMDTVPRVLVQYCSS